MRTKSRDAETGASGRQSGLIENEFRAPTDNIWEDSVFVVEALRGTYS